MATTVWIASDTDPHTLYAVTMERGQALSCTCPAADSHVGLCKHSERAELKPAFERARWALIRFGYCTDRADFDARFEWVRQLMVASGIRNPGRAYNAAMRAVIKRAQHEQQARRSR